MGQTLTHGIYLPDEGERNCYNGLAANWSILDGAVGTIAEHTSALSGKAPLVHTHTKADITDFPAYGNAAGTICEGNDSRLSDARTPVAHTHGKADITDLFNSANTWTEDNIFNKPIQIQKTSGATEIEIKNLNIDITNNTITSEVDDIRFLDKNAKITGGVRLTYDNTKVTQRVYARSYSSNGESSAQIALELKSDQQNNIKEATISSKLLPATNNTYDLGSSSYQWNNLYAKRVNTQSVNGCNPGALSLPDFSKADPIDTRNWVTSPPTNNAYTPSENGWLNVVVADSSPSANEFSLYVKSTNFFASAVHKLADIDDSKGKVGLFIPVIAGITYYVVVKGNVSNVTISATLYPCLGNV